MPPLCQKSLRQAVLIAIFGYQTKQIMKKYFTLLALLPSFSLFAQSPAPKASAGFSHSPNVAVGTGINNNTGLLGVDVEVPLVDQFSLDGGLGLSTWGYKFTGSGRYYLKPGNLGWALSAGFTMNTGLAGFQNDMETIYGNTERVELDMLPTTNIFFSVYKFVALGKGKSRFYFNLGYSAPTSSRYYTQISGDPISKQSEKVMSILRPGGIIAAIGFSFGTGR